MLMNWRLEAEKIGDWIKENRVYFHQCPELGDKEFKTAEHIEIQLKSIGLRIERLLDTAVIGYLDVDKSLPTVALRSDIDALPILEETGVSYASLNPGCMHACGHDVHMSSALGAARLLSEHKSVLKGNVRFIFQPSEEKHGGARRLIDLGVCDGVKATFGMHVSPELKFGDVGIRYGKFYAASDEFVIDIEGKSAHGAQPEMGINALLCGARMVLSLQELPKKLLPDKSVVTVGIFKSGTADNILAGSAHLAGICRTLGSENRAYLEKLLNETIESESAFIGAKAKLRLIYGYGGIVNTDNETAVAERALCSMLGAKHVVRIEEPTMLSEDFGCYIDASLGSFYHLGVGGDYSLHSANFLAPKDSPILGAAVHAQVISEYLRSL